MGASVFRESRLESLANYLPRRSGERVQVAAVCYRRRRGPIEFLLVRTRGGRWTFPKGGVDGDATFSAAAEREAFEEAGARGAIESAPFVFYRHVKSGTWTETLVAAYLCEVETLASPSEPFRFPTWCGADEARQRLAIGRDAESAAELGIVVDRALMRRRGKQLAISD